MAAHLLHRIIDRLPVSVLRFLFNAWGPFRGAGIKVDAISPDFLSFKISMKLTWSNKNYVGVHYGGSIFSMVDPFYMLILSRNLGDQYIVWDKAAFIEFKKPGRGTLTAHCAFSFDEINKIRIEANQLEKYIFEKPINIFNSSGEIVASVIKTLYVRHK